MKKLFSAGLLLLFATSSCIFVVSDTDCEHCRNQAKAHYDNDHDHDGDEIEYVDER